ncbi:MAG: protein kinase [Verrucomicrobia bacterium]|nr:protein kinase [Verrucomicrobiota bacterium]
MKPPQHPPVFDPKLVSGASKTGADDSKTLKDSHPAPDAPHAPHAPHPAPRIPDHELLTRIGRGSYGEVWLARNVMGTYRAIKIVYRATFEHARPFDREFNGIKKFEPISRSHDGLVDILQVGRTDDCFFYVMELADDVVAGPEIDPASYTPKTLRSELKAHERLPFESCVQFGISLTQALGYMHARGLIHRDIKPSNIIFVNGLPKLADIGLVAEQSEAKSFVGTEGFIPPEGPGLPQADLYSLGKVLYEIATGKDRHEFPELPSLIDETEGDNNLLELNSVFLKACQSDLKLRYQTAEQMRDDLLLLQSGKSVQRAQAVERRFEFLKRLSVVGATVTSLLVGGFAYTRHQAIRAQRAEQETRSQLYVSDMIHAEKALNSGNISRAEQFLDTHVRNVGRADLRGFEYHYLRQLCAGEQLFTFPPQERPVFTVAYSPDGKLLATGSSYVDVGDKDYLGQPNLGQLKLIDLATRTEMATIPVNDGVRCAAFSPDGKLLATGSAGSAVTLWDTATHEQRGSFYGGGGAARKVIFSPDGKWLAAIFHFGGFVESIVNRPGRIVFWDVAAQKETNLVSLEGRKLSSLAFSPDGKTLAMADFGLALRLWDLKPRKVVADAEIPFDGDVRCLDYAADSRTLVFGLSSGVVGLWLTDARQIIKLGTHQDKVVSASFSRDGRHLVTGAADGTVKLWDPTQRREVRLLRGHSDRVEQVVFSPDGTEVASASHDRTVRLWPVTPIERNVLRGHANRVTALDFSPNGRSLATASLDQTVKIWDLVNGEVRTLTGFTNAPRCLAFSSDGKYLAAGVQEGIRVWRTAPWRPLTDLPRFQPPSVLDSWKMLEVIPGVGSAKFSRDGKFLCAGEMNFVGIWEVGSWRLVTNFGASIGLAPVACSPDNELLVTGDLGKIQLWRVGSWTQFKTLLGQDGYTWALALTPDGRSVVAGGSDSIVRIWDIASEQPRHSLKGQIGRVTGLAIAPDGKTLAVSDLSGAIKLWNLATCKELFTLPGHAEGVYCLAFSLDGKILASGSSDTTVRLWRTGGSESQDSSGKGNDE